jgi:hypothetical protein
MSRVSLACLFLLLVAGAAARAQDDPGDPAALRERVAALVAPSLAGRVAGSAGEVAAGDSLRAWLAGVGLRPAFAGQWSQVFPLQGDSLAGRESRNVAGVVPGRGALAGRWIVLGAHLDHLGVIGAGPAAPGNYYPGANDNAAGVVAVAAAAAQLAAAKDAADRRSVLVVGFAAEEAGLQGSAWLCNHLPVARDSVDAMLNLDTIGVLTENRLYVGGVGTSPAFASLVADAAQDLPVATSRAGWSGGDHVNFLLAKIPSLALFGGPYPEYNTPGDDLAVIHLDDLSRVVAFAARVADALRRYQAPLPYDDVAPVTAAGEGGDGHRDAWFGTVPAFGTDAVGYTIGQVVAGGPAARGGLRDGDLLEELGGVPVTDLGTFTRALRTHAPGEPVEVVVRRDGRSLRFTVVVGSRQDRR